jgi:hypothetical protein
VRRQSVPEKEDAASAEVAFELAEEPDQRGGGVRAGAGLEEQATAKSLTPSSTPCWRRRAPVICCPTSTSPSTAR